MRHYVMHQPVSRRALLRVQNVHQTVRAGTDAASVCVRTLDGVSVCVCAGELVILRGGVASGAPSLAAFMAGRRHGIRGEREIVSGLRVRRGSITTTAFHALRTAWDSEIVSRAAVPTASPHNAHSMRAPVVYVFRVRADVGSSQRAQLSTGAHPSTGTLSPTRAADTYDAYNAWREWAHTVRAQGGSVVVQCAAQSAHPHPAHPRAAHPRAAQQRKHRERLSPAVHEGPSAFDDQVRVITLANGRIVDPHASAALVQR